MEELRKEKIQKAKLALLSMQRYSWEQGVAMQAFLEQGDKEIVFAMAKEAAYRRTADGRAAMIGAQDAVTDPCSVGEALLYAARQTGDGELLEAHRRLLEWALEKAPRNADGTVYHIDTAPQFWVDSLYMLPPYLAAAGYPKEAVRQIKGYWSALYDPKSGLMSHMWDDGEGCYLRKDHWGVGNGWAMAGLARVIDLLPLEMASEKEELSVMARNLVEAVSRYIREDGLAHDVLDHPETFVETNLPQMLAYSIYRGIRSGWLESSCQALADRCRRAAEDQVDRFGLVQNVCGAPDFSHAGVAPEGQAFFLLMEAVSF